VAGAVRQRQGGRGWVPLLAGAAMLGGDFSAAAKPMLALCVRFTKLTHAVMDVAVRPDRLKKMKVSSAGDMSVREQKPIFFISLARIFSRFTRPGHCGVRHRHLFWDWCVIGLVSLFVGAA